MPSYLTILRYVNQLNSADRGQENIRRTWRLRYENGTGRQRPSEVPRFPARSQDWTQAIRAGSTRGRFRPSLCRVRRDQRAVKGNGGTNPGQRPFKPFVPAEPPPLVLLHLRLEGKQDIIPASYHLKSYIPFEIDRYTFASDF